MPTAYEREIMKTIATLVFCCLLCGCATLSPPPRIENGRYINPECNFSIQIPDGWSMTPDKYTDAFKKNINIPGFNPSSVKAAIVAPDGKSKIFIIAEKTKADWSSFKVFSEQFIAALYNNFAKEKKELIEKYPTATLNYTVFKDNIGDCNGHCIASFCDSSFNLEGIAVKVSEYGILYETSDGMLSAAKLMLMAGGERHDADFPILKSTVDSLNPM
jgi:hypothetical protein